MKCSLAIFYFLEEISSHSHSIVFLYFFVLITEEGFLISPCYSLELCIQMGISFLFSFAFSFSSFLSYLYSLLRQPFCLSFSCGWFWSLPFVQISRTSTHSSSGSLSIRSKQFNSVQLLSPVWLFATPWTAAHQASLSVTNSWSLLKLIPWIYLSLLLYSHMDFDLGHTCSGFPYFFQFKSEFGNELIIWATVSSWSCFDDCIGVLHLPLQRI